MQGGTATNKYYIGAGLSQQEADIRPINFDRASLKINLDQKIGDKVQVGTSNSIYRTKRNQARAGDVRRDEQQVRAAAIRLSGAHYLSPHGIVLYLLY